MTGRVLPPGLNREPDPLKPGSPKGWNMAPEPPRLNA